VTTETDEIAVKLKEEAIRRLDRRREVDIDVAALAGAAGLDAGAVREIFPKDDDLLTALVLDAYNAMSDGAEAAAERASGARPIDRWVAICLGVREWAMAHRNEYALIWGQPVPGYEAPPETMAAGARTVLALLAVVRDAMAGGQFAEPAGEPRLSPAMAANVAPLAEGLLAGLSEHTIARMLVIWTQLHGMLGFEVYGHIAGVAGDPEAFFVHAAHSMGVYVGIR
jgi:hypothetical protein